MRRVLIVGNGSLFDEGLSRLLLERALLDVTRITFISTADFLQHFLRLRPEVVIVFQGGPLGVGRIFELLKDMPDMAALRVITVMAESNTVELYQWQQMKIVGTDDLCSLIQHRVPMRAVLNL
jgi:hypothetical protein